MGTWVKWIRERGSEMSTNKLLDGQQRPTYKSGCWSKYGLFTLWVKVGSVPGTYLLTISQEGSFTFKDKVENSTMASARLEIVELADMFGKGLPGSFSTNWKCS
jgi:hypothetical protein